MHTFDKQIARPQTYKKCTTEIIKPGDVFFGKVQIVYNSFIIAYGQKDDS